LDVELAIYKLYLAQGAEKFVVVLTENAYHAYRVVKYNNDHFLFCSWESIGVYAENMEGSNEP